LMVTVSGCGMVRESRLNPFNWFGSATPAQPAPAPDRIVAPDRRELAAQITGLTIEPTPDGAIVRATALPPTLGFWDAELVALDKGESGKITYEFRYRPPVEPMAASTPQARSIVAAAFLSNKRLQLINEVLVQGATNALTSRR